MKKTLFASIATLTVLAAGSAFAADIHGGRDEWSMKDGPALMPVARWQGFYAGGHLGYAWGETDMNNHNTWYNIDFDTGTFESNGIIGGLQVGYNFQRGNLVFGLESDLGHLGLDGDGGIPDRGYSLSGGFYGDITGRLGYAAGRSLFYVKGGAAFMRVDLERDYGGPAVDQEDHTLWGWTAGAGVEYMVSSNWSIKAEYQHFDFREGTTKYQSDITTWAPTADAVTFGVNYHVQGAEQPLK